MILNNFRLNDDLLVRSLSSGDKLDLGMSCYYQSEQKERMKMADMILCGICYSKEAIQAKKVTHFFTDLAYAVEYSIAKKLNHIGGYANFTNNIWIDGKYPFVVIKTGDQEYNHEHVYYALDGNKEFSSIDTLDIVSMNNILLAVETKINSPEKIKDYGKFIE